MIILGVGQVFFNSDIIIPSTSDQMMAVHPNTKYRDK